MVTDPKKLVSSGYDQVAEQYLARYGRSSVRDRWLGVLVDRLAGRGRCRVLDLGCGAGVPVARALVEAGHRVVGIDASRRQIALAHRHVRGASLVLADATEVAFREASFDATAAFYSIPHVPRAEHEALLENIFCWLRPGGVLVASLGARSSADWEGVWLGTRMFFSHFDAKRNRELLRRAGFTIERAEVQEQDDEDARFLWVVAKRPERAPDPGTCRASTP